MTNRAINRLTAAAVFVASFGVYLLTLAPTVVFWDVGEFIAAAKMMQVPHPPGSPLFLLVTRFAMMLPVAADQAVRAHMLSALFSGLGILFTYLVAVKIIEMFRGAPTDLLDKLTVYGASAIGALALAFSTSYWGNSIEAEVYGASMFFLTAILWLILRWRERSEIPGNEKYLLLIAYLIGLSLGVHLLALLAIFPVMMIIYFRKFELSLSTFMQFGLVTVGVFIVVYPGIVKFLPGMMDGDFMGKKSAVDGLHPVADHRRGRLWRLLFVQEEAEDAALRSALHAADHHRVHHVCSGGDPFQRQPADERERPEQSCAAHVVPRPRAVRRCAAVHAAPLQPGTPSAGDLHELQQRHGFPLPLPAEPHVLPVSVLEFHRCGR